MFKAKIRAQDLIRFFNSASVLSNESKLKINERGISMKVVDTANVCMISSVLKNNAFSTYEATDGEIGLNLERLVSLLKSSGNADYVELEHLEEESKIKLSSNKLNFKLGLISLDVIRKEPEMPEIEYNTKLMFKGNDLKQAIKIGEKIGDILEFTITKDKLILSSSDRITSDMNYTIETENDMISSSINEEVNSTYDIGYLSDISRIIGDNVTIKIKTDYPILISSDFANGEGSITYILAPRVE